MSDILAIRPGSSMCYVRENAEVYAFAPKKFSVTQIAGSMMRADYGPKEKFVYADDPLIISVDALMVVDPETGSTDIEFWDTNKKVTHVMWNTWDDWWYVNIGDIYQVDNIPMSDEERRKELGLIPLD